MDGKRNEEATAELTRRTPAVPWDALNQAAIHTVHHRFGGDPVESFTSITEVVASWPETGTAVAARLSHDDTIELCAPHGLDDCSPASGVATRPRQPQRIPCPARQERWPGVNVIPLS
ncbi:nucleotidyltransferase family protein [Actinoplanes sp. TBRC 11911]|uniref:nucleotidyltransferase family protein n=1 Tax=Actinoplanes sp. TBRC 11911 TaxID=2729386 RepID=UPI00145DB3D4|nr:nucleotidyltransferase family protein [Actinoplanes sp. TBRC 11911]